MLKCKQCGKEYEDHKDCIMTHDIDEDEYKLICRKCITNIFSKADKKVNSYAGDKLFIKHKMGQP